MSKFSVCTTKYDSVSLFESTSKWVALNWLDSALRNIAGFSLIDELNGMQLQIFDSKLFETKDKIPVYFINLVIKEFNIEMREE
ncbi:hypothetical protein RsY01_363 [Lactococcus reticulitermitis]|uniref:Uncharacterized protein n=2 Tax=Pseudolactococcus reticulitermitis TaxID=2025039 RepID=A0A224XAU3_9LACT|nr:hypothetical protein RsY01_363 [Lactococcus reticulitermitis]